jgi:DNA-directed RNA polymerase subunit RPC12/RpoP
VDRDDEREAFEREWAALSEEVLSEEVLSGMADWRAQHPHATLSESEGALDGRLARLRERAAPQSAVTTWRQQASDQEDAAPRCPQCGTRLEPHGRRTDAGRGGCGLPGGSRCSCSGSTASVRSVGRGFSPVVVIAASKMRG